MTALVQSRDGDQLDPGSPVGAPRPKAHSGGGAFAPTEKTRSGARDGDRGEPERSEGDRGEPERSEGDRGEPRDEARIAELRAERCPPEPEGWNLWGGYHCTLDKELRRAYGFGCEHFWRVFVSQGEVCGVCHKPPGVGRLVVDEDEDTHEFRGLCHRGCNGKITPHVARYILDPPARQVGQFFVDPDRFAKRRRRLDKKAKARRAKKAAEAQASLAPSGGYAARLAARRNERKAP